MLETQGYGTWLFWAIAFVGIVVLLWRPKWVMLLTIGLETALSIGRLSLTQFAVGNVPLDPHDILLLLALLSVLATGYRKRQQIYVPLIVVGLVWVLMFGFLLSAFKIPRYMFNIIGWLRWGLTLPVYYFVGRNECGDRQMVNLLLWTVMLGALVGSGTHVLWSCVLLLKGDSLESIRNINYLTGASAPWAVAAVARGTAWMMDARCKRLLVFLSVMMSLMSIAISLTRSLWISVIMAIPLTWIVFRKRRMGSAKVRTNLHGLTILGFGVATVAVLSLLFSNILPTLTERMLSVGELFQGNHSMEFGDRIGIFALDFAAWLHSPLVGQGLGYWTPLVGNVDYSAIKQAWGHLGYITTLAQLGLVGFGVFYVWLPAAVIKSAKLLWVSADDTARQLGLLGGAWMIMVLIEFLMSGNFITIGISSAALTWGALAAYRALLQGERSRETAQ